MKNILTLDKKTAHSKRLSAMAEGILQEWYRNPPLRKADWDMSYGSSMYNIKKDEE